MNYVTPEIVASVSDVDAAFGGGTKYLPPVEAIPDDIESSPFYQVAADIFYHGAPTEKSPNMTLKSEFEPVAERIPAFARSILGSFEPKHEHKMGGMAVLLSEMFEVPENERR